jgi:hypothetical protein
MAEPGSSLFVNNTVLYHSNQKAVLSPNPLLVMYLRFGFQRPFYRTYQFPNWADSSYCASRCLECCPSLGAPLSYNRWFRLELPAPQSWLFVSP